MATVQINLLTKEFRATGPSFVDGLNRWVVIAGVLGIVSVGAWQYSTLYDLTKQQSQVQAESNRLKADVTKVLQMQTAESRVSQVENSIKSIHTNQTSVNALLASIQSKTPPGVSVTSFAFANGTVTLNISAGSFSQVQEFVISLRGDKTFSTVDISSLGLAGSQGGGESVQGVVSFMYGKGAKSK